MAKTLRPDVIQLQMVVDGSPARKELAERSQDLVQMKERVKDLRAEEKRLIEQRRASKGDAEKEKQYAAELARVRGEIKQTNTAIGEQETRMAELRKGIGTSALSIRELNKELRAARVALANATPGTEQWGAAKARVDELKTAYDRLTKTADLNADQWANVRAQYRLTDMTMEQLEMEANRLRAAMRQINPNTREFARYNRELAMVTRRQRALSQQGSPLARFFGNIKREMSGVLGLTAGLFAGGMVVSRIGDWVRASAKLSDAQADVRRTTGLTQESVEELTSSLGKMNTRTPRSELLALAADAGKLGITGVQDIQKFVRAGDQIKVALGEDLGDDAIKNIGKLNQTFKVGEATGKDLEQQMLSTGSAINALGQASTAQESFLVDYATRMAGVNTQAEISIQNTLGYGAALDQLGQRSETSSTAISQFTLKAFKETATYARIAGMETAEFAKLLDSDANEALLRVLEGLKGNNEGLGRMTELFSDMGQEGARAVGVLASLANNTQLVREQQAIANKEFAQATSITDEFNTKNNTLAANLDIIQKRLIGAFVNSGVVDAVNDIVGAIRRWVEVPLSATMEDQQAKLLGLQIQLHSTNTTTQQRIRIIKELQAQYPGYLGHLDAERATNEQINAAISRLNQAMVRKIILQQQDERLQEEGRKVADDRIEMGNRQLALQKSLGALQAEYNLKLREDLTLQEQARDLLLQIKAINDGSLPAEAVKTAEALRLFEDAVRRFGAQESIAASVQREVDELLSTLGIDQDIPDPFSGGGGFNTTQFLNQLGATGPFELGGGDTPSAGGSGAQEAAQTATTDHFAAMEQMLRDHRERVYQFGLDADERELRQLDVKHAEELAALLANEQATHEDMLNLMRIHAQERADLIAQHGNERLEARERVAEQVRRATLSDEELELLQAMDHWDGLIAQAEEYGIDTTLLLDRREAAQAAIRKRWRDKELTEEEQHQKQLQAAKMQALTASAQAIGGLSDVMAAFYDESQSQSFEQTAAAKVLALIQIKIAAAVAVANAIVAATDAAAKGGVAAPYLVAANIGIAVGAVLAAIAQARNLLGSAGDPPQQNVNGPTAGSNGPTAVPLGEHGMVVGEDGGTLRGPSHRESGLGVYNNLTGEQVAELEGGELVLSKRFTQVNADQVGTLLRASKEGRRLNFINRPLPSINPRATQYLADGGLIRNSQYTFKKGTGGYAGPDTGGGGENPLLVALLQEMRAVRAAAERFPTEVKAKVGLVDQERRTIEYEKIKARSKAKRA